MVRATLKCCAALICGLATLTALARAEEKGKAIPPGAWALKGGELKLEFCDKQVLKIFPHGDPEVIAVVCSYTLDKDKRVQAKITDLSGKAKDQIKERIPVGTEFSFAWQVKDDAATLAGVKGKEADLFKAHLEGDYIPKK